MNKKTFALVSGIIGGVEAIAVAIVSYIQPGYMTEINAAIVIVGTAVLEVCNLFNKGE